MSEPVAENPAQGDTKFAEREIDSFDRNLPAEVLHSTQPGFETEFLFLNMDISPACCWVKTHSREKAIMKTPGTDQIKGQWRQHVGAAKIAWGKLTEDELMQAEGQQEKLVGLIQERYAVTRDAAQKQVKEFMDKHEL